MKDSVSVEQVMVAVCDSITETTTITIRENEAGDTIKVVQLTERDRVHSKADVRSVKEEVMVVRDTVYIEHQDSRSMVQDSSKARASLVVSALKWIFGIIVLVIILITILKYRSF